MNAWEKLIPSVHQKRIGGRIANELLMMLRAKKKCAKEVSLYEPVGTDKEGNEINLLDILENGEREIADSVCIREDILRLFRILYPAKARKTVCP